MMGLARGTVRWDDGRGNSQSANAWGAADGGSGSSTAAGGPGAEADGEVEAGRKKGKGNKKQTLYRFG